MSVHGTPYQTIANQAARALGRARAQERNKIRWKGKRRRHPEAYEEAKAFNIAHGLRPIKRLKVFRYNSALHTRKPVTLAPIVLPELV